jgi:type VI secretion system secreted protein VgrG
MKFEVGGAMIANGPTISLEAEEEIKITVGGSSLTIAKSSIELKAPSLASPGATIAKDGSAIHHNP